MIKKMYICVFCLLRNSGDLHKWSAKYSVLYAFSDKTMSLLITVYQ